MQVGLTLSVLDWDECPPGVPSFKSGTFEENFGIILEITTLKLANPTLLSTESSAYTQAKKYLNT